jgi:hypothetical protein
MNSEAPDYTVAITAFANAARHYIVWCEHEKIADAQKLQLEAMRHLSQLYSLALALPEVDESCLIELPDPPKIEDATRRRIYESFSALPLNYYREVFSSDYKSNEAPVTGDIADDLTDIYLDLKNGLALFDRGSEPNAVWHWRFTFGIHWGRHALSVIRAMHCHED